MCAVFCSIVSLCGYVFLFFLVHVHAHQSNIIVVTNLQCISICSNNEISFPVFVSLARSSVICFLFICLLSFFSLSLVVFNSHTTLNTKKNDRRLRCSVFVLIVVVVVEKIFRNINRKENRFCFA